MRPEKAPSTAKKLQDVNYLNLWFQLEQVSACLAPLGFMWNILIILAIFFTLKSLCRYVVSSKINYTQIYMYVFEMICFQFF